MFWKYVVKVLFVRIRPPPRSTRTDTLFPYTTLFRSRLAVTGPPNAGKSSLVNKLTERDVAIVTAIPGTTRDRIEAHLAIRGVPVVAIDTAGLRETGDGGEREGVARARASVVTADHVLAIAGEGGACERVGPPTPGPRGMMR